MTIEAKDVEEFKVFIRGICGATSCCDNFIRGCRLCLEAQKIGILIRDPWLPKKDAFTAWKKRALK